MPLLAVLLGSAALAAPADAPARVPATEAARPATLTLALGGDVQYGRYQHGALARHCGDTPFGALLGLLRDADLTFVNLENPVTTREPRPVDPRPYTYRLRAPPSIVPGLRDAGIDVVSVANNHSLDSGPAGMRDTLAHLTAAGLLPVGISFERDPRLPVTLEVHGVRVHVFAGTTFVNRKPALRDRLALVTLDELEGSIAEQIAALRTAEPDAVILVSLHWGFEGAGSPREQHQRAGRRLIDAGANVVAGHHTHVLNTVEVYADGAILYNLGNLLFDMPEEELRRTAIAHVTLARAAPGWRVDAVRLHPVWRGPGTDAPVLAPAAEAQKLFDRILPEARDRFATPFGIEQGVAVWRRPAVGGAPAATP